VGDEYEDRQGLQRRLVFLCVDTVVAVRHCHDVDQEQDDDASCTALLGVDPRCSFLSSFLSFFSVLQLACCRCDMLTKAMLPRYNSLDRLHPFDSQNDHPPRRQPCPTLPSTFNLEQKSVKMYVRLTSP
jgi:hypothetical protein